MLIDLVLLAVLAVLVVPGLIRRMRWRLRRDHRLTRTLVRRSVLIGAGGMLTAVALLPVLPFAMGIVTDVQHSYTATVPAENRGAYLVTDDGVMQLYTWRVDPATFPGDAPRLPAGDVSRLAVVQKRFDPPEDHVLRDLESGRVVAWASARQEDTVLTLRPSEPLAPGRYRFRVPADSMYGGVTTHYFIVDERPAG